MKRDLIVRPFFGFLIVLLIATIVSLFGYQTLKARDNADALITHTDTVMSAIDEVLLGLVNMETGFRGYLLTGSQDFLHHYTGAKIQYGNAMEKLMELTRDNPGQEARWKEVDALEKQWVTNWAEKGIQIREQVNQGQLTNAALVSHAIAEQDENLMDTMRIKLSQGKQAETTLLEDRIHQEQAANRRGYYVMVGGIAFSLILGLGTGFWMNRLNIENARQIELHHLLLQEREKERMQIARDLHDGPVQELVAVAFNLQGIEMEKLPEQTTEELEKAKQLIQDVVADLRARAMELRSPILTKFGLRKAIQAQIETFQQKYPGIEVRFQAQPEVDELSENTLDTLFRICKETMNNVARHAQANQVQIELQKEKGQVVLSVQDDGIGFHPPEEWLSLARHGHLGLVGIRERANAIGGRVDVHSQPGKGTCVRVVVPAK